MSERQWTDAVISLEEVFKSRDFGRRQPRGAVSGVAMAETFDAPQLEQVFLSEFFGHPEAIAATRVPVTEDRPPAERPTLVLLAGRGSSQFDIARYRGALGAVSGVAAAALAVAGFSSGTGPQQGPPTISAQGPPPGQNPTPGGGPSPGSGGVATQPSSSGSGPSAPSSGGPAGATVAHVVAPSTAPSIAVVAVAPSPTTQVPPPPPPSAPPPPSSPAPGGTGSVLTPVFVVAGHTVSAVGTTVTTASNGLGQALPVASPVTGLVSNVGATATSLGQSVAGA